MAVKNHVVGCEDVRVLDSHRWCFVSSLVVHAASLRRESETWLQKLGVACICAPRRTKCLAVAMSLRMTMVSNLKPRGNFRMGKQRLLFRENCCAFTCKESQKAASFHFVFLFSHVHFMKRLVSGSNGVAPLLATGDKETPRRFSSCRKVSWRRHTG